jgi:GTPase
MVGIRKEKWMPKRTTKETVSPRERAFLVGVDVYGQSHILNLEDSLLELNLLCDSAGLDVVGEVTQKISHPNPETFIGSGKVEELKALVREAPARVIVFDNELSPRHQRELETYIGENVRILDRTAIILDIFAQHAHSAEGQLQVKLAQYEYYLPRLTGRWTHLARQAGGGGGRSGSVGGVGLRGPGETQLEVDRRAIRHEITHLKDELEKVRARRMRHRIQRKTTHLPSVALVGYTNAGKTTLLNKLSKSDVLVADQLFSTLDPTTRQIKLPEGYQALLTDTVGFIQKLPTTLVAAFRATLEEIAEADLLLHVVDISHPNAMNQAEAVHETLEEIDAEHVPVITVLNKIDRLSDPDAARVSTQKFPQAVAISARSGNGIDDLLELLKKVLFETYKPIQVFLPYQQGQLISIFHEYGHIEHIDHGRKGVLIQGRIPGQFIAQFKPWEKKKGVRELEMPEDPLSNNGN